MLLIGTLEPMNDAGIVQNVRCGKCHPQPLPSKPHRRLYSIINKDNHLQQDGSQPHLKAIRYGLHYYGRREASLHLLDRIRGEIIDQAQAVTDLRAGCKYAPLWRFCGAAI
jgi:hypothetical protein